MRESRPQPLIVCEGCRHKALPEWCWTADINGTPKTVCMQCAAILTRLGITVTED